MSTMKGTNHNKVVTVLLFYIKQHMHRKYSDDRPKKILPFVNARSRETRFTRPNRRACSQARPIYFFSRKVIYRCEL